MSKTSTIAAYHRRCEACINDDGLCKVCGLRCKNPSVLHKHLKETHIKSGRQKACRWSVTELQQRLEELLEELSIDPESYSIHERIEQVKNDIAVANGEDLRYIGPPYI